MTAPMLDPLIYSVRLRHVQRFVFFCFQQFFSCVKTFEPIFRQVLRFISCCFPHIRGLVSFASSTRRSITYQSVYAMRKMLRVVSMTQNGNMAPSVELGAFDVNTIDGYIDARWDADEKDEEAPSEMRNTFEISENNLSQSQSSPHFLPKIYARPCKVADPPRRFLRHNTVETGEEYEEDF